MNENIQQYNYQDFVLKIRKPENINKAPVLLFLHGWTGNENSMWIFSDKIPNSYLIISPRAPYEILNINYSGYTWVEKLSSERSSLEDFKPAVQKIKNLLDSLSEKFDSNFDSINIAGFSQGAAMAYAFSMIFPSKINKIAGLAGFLPKNSQDKLAEKPLEGKRIFIAHGVKDQIVKIDSAYNARERLQNSGAKINYCESNVGHRLDKNCYSAFAEFIAS